VNVSTERLPTGSMPARLTHLLIAVSAINALYLREFNSLYGAFSAKGSYFRWQSFSVLLAASYYGSLLAMIAIAYLAIEILVRRGWLSKEGTFRLGGAFIVIGLSMTVPSLIVHISPDVYLVRERSAPILIAAVAVLIYIAFCRLAPRVSASVGKAIVRLATPLFLLQLMSLGWQYAHAPTRAALADNPTLKPIAQDASKLHTVWMVFDELDYELSLDMRPTSVEMPEFDRLRSESLSASDAHSPAAKTMVAFPSLLTGEDIKSATPKGTDDLYLDLDSTKGKERVLWKTQPTVFSYARDHGLNGAIVGWYHPYCRIFTSTLADCFWKPDVDALPSLRHELILPQTGFLPVLPGWWGMSEKKQSKFVAAEEQLEYKDMFNHALKTVARPDLNLILLHWLIPHPPGIYDRNQNALYDFDALHTPASDYFDNLELVDFVLGQIRRKLESAGLWDDTTLIVTGDHPLRPSVWSEMPIWTHEEAQLCAKRKDPRVPLLIKLPRQHTAAAYDAPLNTVLIHDLLIRWMQGKDANLESVRAFFDQNRLRFPVLRTPAP
jgi:sulfatase-like protein